MTDDRQRLLKLLSDIEQFATDNEQLIVAAPGDEIAACAEAEDAAVHEAADRVQLMLNKPKGEN